MPAPIRSYRLPIRVVTEYAWHSLFARNLFIADGRAGRSRRTRTSSRRSRSSIRPSFKAEPARHGTRSEVVIALNFATAAGAHRRHELRGRDQEVGLQRC